MQLGATRMRRGTLFTYILCVHLLHQELQLFGLVPSSFQEVGGRRVRIFGTVRWLVWKQNLSNKKIPVWSLTLFYCREFHFLSAGTWRMYQSNGCTGRLLQLLKWLHHQNRDQHEQDKPAMNFSKINFSVIGLFFSFLCLKDLIAKNFGLELSLLAKRNLRFSTTTKFSKKCWNSRDDRQLECRQREVVRNDCMYDFGQVAA